MPTESTTAASSALPDRDDATAGNDENPSEKNWHRRWRSKRQEIDDLPDDEQHCDVGTDDAPEFDGGEVQRNGVRKHQRGAGQEKHHARRKALLVEPHADDGIS